MQTAKIWHLVMRQETKRKLEFSHILTITYIITHLLMRSREAKRRKFRNLGLFRPTLFVHNIESSAITSYWCPFRWHFSQETEDFFSFFFSSDEITQQQPLRDRCHKQLKRESAGLAHLNLPARPGPTGLVRSRRAGPTFPPPPPLRATTTATAGEESSKRVHRALFWVCARWDPISGLISCHLIKLLPLITGDWP